MPLTYQRYLGRLGAFSANPLSDTLMQDGQITPDLIQSLLDNRGGEAFRGSITQDNADRYQQEALRGGAPFTGAGIAAAMENALGVLGGVTTVKTGISSMLNETGLKPPGYAGGVIDSILGPGIQDIPGYYGIAAERRKRIKSHADLVNALAEAKKAKIDAAAAAFAHSMSRVDAGRHGQGGSYAEGGRAATEAHDRSRQGAGV